MFKKIKKVIGYIKQNKKRYIDSKKSLLSILLVIMLVLTCGRAYSVYVRYNEIRINRDILSNTVDDYTELVLRNILEDANMKAYYSNRLGTNNLEKDLLEEHTIDELHASIVNNNFDPSVYDTMLNSMKKHFKSSNIESDTVLIIGTDDDVMFVKSTTDQKKFNDLKGESPLISWDYFFEKMDNPKVTKEAFNKVKYKNTNHQPIILRIDGNYANNEIYTVDDLIESYKENGVTGLEGYGFLTLAAITEDGDIFGNPDDTFMQSNDSTKKIYVYKYTDIDEYIHDHLKMLTESTARSNKSVVEINNSDTADLMISTTSVIFNGVVIIGLMFLYKSIDDEEEDENKENSENKNR